MGLTSEIFLTRNHIKKEEWLELIKIISNYNGYFRNWKIIIRNNNNQIRYFIKTNYSLPTTINNLDSFMLKQTKNIKYKKISIALPFMIKIGNNIVDLINYFEIKNKGKLELLEITLSKIYEDRIKSKTTFYLNKNGNIKKYKAIFAFPISILSVDFTKNKRFFYKKAPNYLDISKILNLLKPNTSSSILKIDTFPYLNGEYYLNQNNYNFDKHSIIIGSSGSGKSKFISLLINNIYKNNNFKQKYKIVVIDPHSSLENDIGGISKVIDFKSKEDSIDLFINNNNDIIVSTELILELLKSLMIDQYNSKLERVLRHSIHILLMNKSFNFSNLRKLLLDLEYRNSLIKKLKKFLPSSVIDFFLLDFNELKTKSYLESISPIIAFIDEMEMLPVFNNQQINNNIINTISNNFLTLFSLDRTILGDKITKTISGLIMQQLLTIISKKEIKEHILFIVDEASIIENPILARLLSEARKYNLSLILVSQYFNQISDNLKNSIFANIINYYIFRVSKQDANILVDNFNIKIPLDDSKERKIKLLTELNNRECIVRVEANEKLLPVFKATTLNYNSIPRIKSINNNQINNEVKHLKRNNNFYIGNNINLKELLMLSSSSRKEIK